jgi:hypothetical protein
MTISPGSVTFVASWRHIVVNKCIVVVRELQSRMTTDWIKQSPGLYRGYERERELHHHYRWMVQHGRRIKRLHKVVQHGRKVSDCI